MKDLLKKYENKQPEIVFNWKDSETDAVDQDALVRRRVCGVPADARENCLALSSSDDLQLFRNTGLVKR